jgi:hypothetical protein
VTLLEHPVLAPPRAPGTVLSWVLLVSTPDPDAAAPALRRETRLGDHVDRDGDDLVLTLAVRAADLDALADRLLTVIERATGRPAAAGVCLADPGLTDPEVLRRARAGMAVAWACGGSRVVRHP